MVRFYLNPTTKLRSIEDLKHVTLREANSAYFSTNTMLVLLFVHVSVLLCQTTTTEIDFAYNGFVSGNLSLKGNATVTPNGLLHLNHDKHTVGQTFYSSPVKFKDSPNSSVISFSTTFIFAMVPQYPNTGGHGLAFVVTPQTALPRVTLGRYLGFLDQNQDGNDTNHVFAVEFDTIQDPEFHDRDDNHVGIDINSMTSKKSDSASYYANDHDDRKSLTLISGKPMQVWVDYDGLEKQINVTLADINIQKPKIPLISLLFDLTPIFQENMFIGFSSSTGSFVTSHYVLGWSFKVNGQAQKLNLDQIPQLPKVKRNRRSKLLTIVAPALLIMFIIALLSLAIVYFVRKRRKFAEVLEDWEREYGPHRFKYKNLYMATKGFRNQELLGAGGFGKVYKGVLPTTEIAVKKVSHDSRQGIREFVAEITSVGLLRHRNILPLLGYCRRKGELILVYEYMPNGSLDKYLYNQPKARLNWSQRFRVIEGVASGLFYLHEGWDHVVIHRDVKASNILLDAEFNARLGDFGLARFYDHGTDPQTTHMAGTLGYLAPELTRTGKATTSTDVFAFGAFLLEVACGRRPIEPQRTEHVNLVDWVYYCWSKGEILAARDPNLGIRFVEEEMALVLKLGLLCSNCEPLDRPSMRHVVQYLEGSLPLPDVASLVIHAGGLTSAYGETFDVVPSLPFSMDKTVSYTSSSVQASTLSGGR